MEFDDAPSNRRTLSSGDPLPPDDWDGFGVPARAEAIYAAERPYVTAIFRKSVPPQEVPDLVQETFRRLFSAKGTGTGLIEASRAYVATAARTILKNRARAGVRSQVQVHHSFDDRDIAGPDPHMVLEHRDMLRRVEDAIAKLNPTTRDVFLMQTFDELSYSEIGRIKGMSEKAVEKHLVKARMAIRKARDVRS